LERRNKRVKAGNDLDSTSLTAKLKGYSWTKIVAMLGVMGMIAGVSFAAGMSYTLHKVGELILNILGNPDRIADLERLVAKYILIQ